MFIKGALYFLLMISFPEKWKLFKFHLGNLICWLYEVGTTLFLTEYSGWWYGASYAFALITSVMFLFVFYVFFVFDIGGHAIKRLRNFILVTTSVYSGSWFLVVLLTEHSRLHYASSIIVVGMTIALFTYHLHEYVVFYD